MIQHFIICFIEQNVIEKKKEEIHRNTDEINIKHANQYDDETKTTTIVKENEIKKTTTKYLVSK